MAISHNVSSLLGQLAQQPLSNTYHNNKALPSASPQTDEELARRASISQKSFSGSGLSFELSLASGKDVEVDIRINQAGGISQLELTSNAELNFDEQKKLQNFLTQLSESVDALFRGEASGHDVFQFANEQGVGDLELEVYQDDGDNKQGLLFEKEGRGSGRKIEAQWYEYDRINDVEENHDLSLRKQEKRDDQTAIYGQMNYQWLFDQINTATSVMDDKTQGKKLAAFFNSGIQALFSNANSGNLLLQELGASAQQAKDVIGRSIKVLASEQRQMNGLPDFTMNFSSQRTALGTSDSEYQLDMDISQVSDQASSADKSETYQTQNRHLMMNYQSARQKAVYEYTWTRDESLRNVFEGGNLASSHYRVEEQVQAKILGDSSGSRRFEEEQQVSYRDREDSDYRS